MLRGRLAGLLAALAAALAPAAMAEPHVGALRVATASVDIRGGDGATYRVGVEVVATGWPATGEPKQQVRLRIAKCGRAGSCAAGVTTVHDVAPKRYADTFDLSLTTVQLDIAPVSIVVQWTTEPGFGWSPGPAPQDDGAFVTTTSKARATFVLWSKTWRVRCFDGAASVGMHTGVTLAPPWQAAVKPRLPRPLTHPNVHRLPSCA